MEYMSKDQAIGGAIRLFNTLQSVKTSQEARELIGTIVDITPEGEDGPELLLFLRDQQYQHTVTKGEYVSIRACVIGYGGRCEHVSNPFIWVTINDEATEQIKAFIEVVPGFGLDYRDMRDSIDDMLWHYFKLLGPLSRLAADRGLDFHHPDEQ